MSDLYFGHRVRLAWVTDENRVTDKPVEALEAKAEAKGAAFRLAAETHTCDDSCQQALAEADWAAHNEGVS